jgi:hypothetical protein
MKSFTHMRPSFKILMRRLRARLVRVTESLADSLAPTWGEPPLRPIPIRVRTQIRRL